MLKYRFTYIVIGMNSHELTQQLIKELGGQAATARLVKVSQPTVYGWYHGLHKPGLSAALRIQRITRGAYPASIWHPELLDDPAA